MDTLLDGEDRLPLTCSRTGTCCHDKAIFLNPWEIACLALEKGCSATEFRAQFTSGGGTRLRMGDSARATCSQYDPSRGCTVYPGRLLACRLFPLGRQRRGETVGYLHRGAVFPCFNECPEVRDLPRLTVSEFLAGQGVERGEAAQDAYLDVTLEFAEGALVLLLDTDLVVSDRETLPRWRRLGAMSDAERAASLPADWLDLLLSPEITPNPSDPRAFVASHWELLQAREALLPTPDSTSALRDSSCLVMASALHLGRGTGIDTAALAEHWCEAARRNGAKE